MKVLAKAQHTPEWFAARRGRLTASEARKALMGKHTKGRRNYVQKIADDLDGIPDFDESDTKPWFVDGIYYESWARGWYSFKYDVDVQQTGFVVHDEYNWIGASPDGLVGDDGLIEIKFRKSLRAFDKHCETGMPASVQPQVQTQMFVCDREWTDYCNYWRWFDGDKEKGHVQRVFRDDAYIQNVLLPAFASFWADVMDVLKQRKLHRARSGV